MFPRAISKICLHKCVILFVTLTFSALPAQSQSCDSLDALACVGSPACIYDRVNDTPEYACVEPSNRCQIGFKQLLRSEERDSGHDSSSIEISALCEQRPGCSFVPAGKCYCPPDVLCICGGGTPPNCEIDVSVTLEPPIGSYEIVDVRNAGDVASPLELTTRGEPIGQALILTKDGLSLPGIGCDEWSVKSADNGISFADPILSDAMIGPIDSQASTGDKRILAHWSYSCEGEHFMTLTEIDDRVLVIPWNNSAQYLIAEIPLTSDEVNRLQIALNSANFFIGELTGQMDSDTMSALGFWAEYRAGDAETFRFARPALTQNLMDGLGVLLDE